MRTFIAINVPKKERERIHRGTRILRDQGFPVRWVGPDLYHITLKFLGEVRPDMLATLEDVARNAAQGTSAFPMRIGGFGAFPTIRRPRVLWLGVDPSPALRCLKQDLEWAYSHHGFERETRAFHPHFTLGRALPDEGAGAFRGLDDLAARVTCEGEVEVRKIDLMESHLSSSGPRYEVLTSFPLKGG